MSAILEALPHKDQRQRAEKRRGLSFVYKYVRPLILAKVVTGTVFIKCRVVPQVCIDI